MPFAIAVTAFLLFTVLLWLGRLGEASYCFLVSAAILLGIVLHGFGRLQELDLKNLRLVLREIDQTKKELFVREERIKSIVVPLAQIMAFTGASEGRWGSTETAKIKRKWYRRKLQELVEQLDLSPNEATEIHKYMDKYDQIDLAIGDREALQTTDSDYAEIATKLKSLSADLNIMLSGDVNK